MQTKELINKISLGYQPNKNEIIKILRLDKEDENLSYLFYKAEQVTLKYCKDEIQIRAIIEFSNYCRCKCAYCGLNCNNKLIKRYRMTIDEIVNTAFEAYEAGYKTIVLQSGEDLWYSKEKICEILKRIKGIGDLAITLSIGEREIEEYKEFKKTGADRFLIKHETADELLYNKLHPHSNFKSRFQCLKELKKLGYQIGSGFMVGLPWQGYDTLAKDLIFLKSLEVDMAGIGPFIPHPETELKNQVKGSTFLTLKVVALARLMLKYTHLPATTSLGVLNELDKIAAFSSGANVIMQKVEPHKYRRLYEIYPSKLKVHKSILEERKDIEKYILKAGKKISFTKGDSFKIK
ncbi:[FeFe] hydrogenase H-cluster radical SAM maturase HydE [Clostridium rectalis]|uniref:[FeFe] hydrogenase H-cluster radical SAM maturase HydE n=1 Tax=Clostridium rectalis TaxID=2040295 RepID=UPI000F634C50|nr:[FeFe] hydrogenase H-cluster radical SAM maturase HydE [Clostridium rectalis]